MTRLAAPGVTGTGRNGALRLTLLQTADMSKATMMHTLGYSVTACNDGNRAAGHDYFDNERRWNGAEARHGGHKRGHDMM